MEENLRVVPKDEMLQLISNQLAAYGETELAQSVSQLLKTSEEEMEDKKIEASHKLGELCLMGKESPFTITNLPLPPDPDCQNFDWISVSKALTSGSVEGGQTPEAEALPIPDQLAWEDRVPPNDPSLAFSVLFTSAHKGEARTVAFSADGKFVASGSGDMSLKVLEVSKMKSPGDEKPMVRALYDHVETVNEVTFHPNSQVLASCSDDNTIKLYDMTKNPAIKKGFRYLQDSSPVKSISFHPSGDFLAAGTDNEKLRIYDVKTLQCYTPSTPGHTSGLTQVRFSSDGGLIASTSLDGSIRLWDGRMGSAARTFTAPHNGRPTGSAIFSKSGAYLLTTGLDGIVRLWDIASGKQLKDYVGGNSQRFSQACFDYNERCIYSTSSSKNGVVAWDVRSGGLIKLWVAPVTGSHHTPQPVLCVATNPIEPGFAAGSDDSRIRFWSLPGVNP